MEAKEAFSQPFVCQLPALAQNELGMLVRSFVSFFFSWRGVAGTLRNAINYVNDAHACVRKAKERATHAEG